MKQIYDFMARHLTWILALLICLLLVGFAVPLVKTIYTSIIYWALAVGLSGIAIFAITTIKFTKIDNEDTSKFMWLGKCIVMAAIIFGTFYLIANVTTPTRQVEDNNYAIEKFVPDTVKADTNKIVVDTIK